MGSKNKYNKAYDSGYKDGKKGGFVDDLANSLSSVIPSIDKKEDQSYDQGYIDGSADRHDDKNSNYKGGTSEDSGGCYITSATMKSLGKEDTCDELMSFRYYRDQWLSNEPNGKMLIDEYYHTAPLIVNTIDSQENSKDIYNDIWNTYLSPCYDYIKKSNNNEAKELYVQMVKKLKRRFL